MNRLVIALVLGALLARGPAVAAEPALNVPEPEPSHRLAAALVLGGVYGGWVAAQWLIVYRDRQLYPFAAGGEDWFSDGSYAGGADKLGHLWGNLVCTRLGTDVLRLGGWDTLPASVSSAGLSFAFFFLVEVKDGFFHVFSYSDLMGNAAGAVLGAMMENFPTLDGALDVRVQWFPSKDYRRDGSHTFFVEDYSGQSYLFALKPRALRAVREGRWSLRWLQLVNPVIGFQTRGYQPAPAATEPHHRAQELFVGITVDLQALSDLLLDGAASRPARWGHQAAHTVTEFLNPPFSTLKGDLLSRSPD